MAAIDGGYTNLVQGVSQQDRRDRREGQCTEQINMSSSIIDGLTRRLPTSKVADLFKPEVANGKELVKNHSFTSASNWTLHTGWSISGGEAKLSSSAAGSIKQSVTLGGKGTRYRVRFSIANYVSGQVRIGIKGADGSYALGAVRSAHGRYEDILELDGKRAGSNEVEISPVTGAANLSIDDVSVQELVSGDVQFHEVNVAAKTYLMATAHNVLKVFDIDGKEQKVNLGSSLDAKDYMSADMSTCVIGDTVFMASASRKVRMTDTLVSRTPYAIVQVLGGQYARNYTVSLSNPSDPSKDIVTTFGTPDGSNSNHAGLIATDYIASELYTKMVNNPVFNTHYIVARKDDVLLIGWKSALKTDRIEVTSSDGQAGTRMTAVSDRTDKVGNLPKWAPNNHIVEVTGLETNDEDAAYYRFDQEVPGFGNDGLWVETTAPGIPYQWDKRTMPHTLKYDRVKDEFSLSQGEWRDRQVGDLTTNPDRSFIANPILDLAEFQGRLVMVSTNSVVMSRTNKPFDLFKTSATVNSDSDPIDVSSSSGSGRSLLYAQMHNRDLVIFADKAQFIIFGRNANTPKNTSMVLTTGFAVSDKCRPVVAGKHIFFAFDKGAFSSIKEFFTEGSADINDSRPITAHVPKFIKGSATQIAASANADVALVLGEDKRTSYMYEYMWDDRGVEKVQASWSTFTTALDTEYAFFVDNVLYLVSRAGDKFVMSKGNLDITDDAGVGYPVYMDMKTTGTGTSVTTAYPEHLMDKLVVIQGEGCTYPGLPAYITSRTGTTLNIEDTGGGTLIIGVPFTSSYKPTMPVRRDRKGVKISTGELVIDEFLIAFEDTGQLNTRIISGYYDPVEDYYSGFLSDTPSAILGTQPITSGNFIVGFGDDADLAELEIYTDSHLPMTITGLEYSGQWNKDGRRVN